MSQVRDILIRARAHISDPAMWYKGDLSAEGYYGAIAGSPCCAAGAVYWAAPEDAENPSPQGWGNSPAERAISALQLATGKRELVGMFNDHPRTTHADILALFDRAIAAQVQP